jgi:hypothetical protein
VLVIIEPLPTAVLLFAVVLANKASLPTAVLDAPVVFEKSDA